jgi:hypothetical protein
MNQPVALGGIFWLFISSIILYYIFGASQVPNKIQQNINKAVKAVIGIFFFCYLYLFLPEFLSFGQIHLEIYSNH